MKMYHEYLLNEIIQIIKDNLHLIYKYDDDSLFNIRKHCLDNIDKEYVPISYNKLIYFTEEALADLINTPDLYDFRTLE